MGAGIGVGLADAGVGLMEVPLVDDELPGAEPVVAGEAPGDTSGIGVGVGIGVGLGVGVGVGAGFERFIHVWSVPPNPPMSLSNVSTRARHFARSGGPEGMSALFGKKM